MTRLSVLRDRALIWTLDLLRTAVSTVEDWMAESRLALDEEVSNTDRRLARNGYERD
jgi:hypothetical protein